MSEWIDVGEIHAIPSDELTAFRMHGEEILVYRKGNDCYAYANRCTHDEAVPLSNGYLVRGSIVCQMHGSKFDLKTGACLRGPGSAGLQVYPSIVRDRRLYIQLPAAPAQVREVKTCPAVIQLAIPADAAQSQEG